MMYAADLVLICETKEAARGKLIACSTALESMVIALRVEVNDPEEHLKQKRLKWFGHMVRRGGDKESVEVENRRTRKERQASETMD